MKTYAVKEIFYSIRGEGLHAGKTAVFIRMAGCNLWSGREGDRASAACRFCDTDFVGGERLTAAEITRRSLALWPGELNRWCVLTGGEPALQSDWDLVRILRLAGFSVAMETNGTIQLPFRYDWLTMSPKAGTEIKQRYCDELKLVYPQDGITPDDLAEIATTHRYLQPMDGPELERNRALAVAYSLAHPAWCVSLQIHKLLGVR